ncbi:bifunctional oligoribonuclease/PAP phosphatase NrnA [Paenibacillus sp. IB182496]|uniref:Bifunctional oligoribonuclease/PAP phosphatase NrnA n=1 Tax=Paenibacillus sabuli TaxID=2772509 RepID=A0A927BS14_9BACL|nr:bifunctional oligoribonuclease/PAP phosphatase NrnA [Paenibacillus sabuli]MBD2845242.1 bifunctional oligoribonuclease/PAP phosphatase NrnA [Paenibacillus sabuli]
MSGAVAGYREQLDAALRFLREGDDYLVVSHVQPDGDAISSTVIIGWLLGKLGKRYVLANEDEVPGRLRFLPLTGSIVQLPDTDHARRYARVVSVDCADFRRIGTVSQSFADGVQLLNIDHHPTNDQFGAVNVVRTNAAATAEILYDLIAHAGLALDMQVAEPLYVGLLTDTGGFRYANTSAHVLRIAAELIGHGVSGSAIAERMLEMMTMPQLQLLQRGLSRLQFTAGGRIGWLYIEHSDLAQTGAAGEDLEGLVNYARNVEGVEVGILFKGAADGGIKVSMRSAGKVDVAAIAQRFGGGGHTRAAGCRLECSLTEASARVLAAISEVLPS